jgi:hypothetical protein
LLCTGWHGSWLWFPFRLVWSVVLVISSVRFSMLLSLRDHFHFFLQTLPLPCRKNLTFNNISNGGEEASVLTKNNGNENA